MLPRHLIEDFWDSVSRELREKKLQEDQIPLAISRYRSALDRHEVDEWVYHRNPEAVAEIIAAGWESGFPDPKISD